MRNRTYISSCNDNWSIQECIEKSLELKNVFLFSIKYKSIFINGKRYASGSSISNESLSNMFYMSLHEYDNIILLNNRGLKDTDNKPKSVECQMHIIGEDDTVFTHVNEPTQIFPDIRLRYINGERYHWFSSNPDVATVDDNNIIFPKSEGWTLICYGTIDALTSFGEATFKFYLSVVPEGHSFTNIIAPNVDPEHNTHGLIDTITDIIDNINLELTPNNTGTINMEEYIDINPSNTNINLNP